MARQQRGLRLEQINNHVLLWTAWENENLARRIPEFAQLLGQNYARHAQIAAEGLRNGRWAGPRRDIERGVYPGAGQLTPQRHTQNGTMIYRSTRWPEYWPLPREPDDDDDHDEGES